MQPDTVMFVPVFNQEREIPLVIHEIRRSATGVEFLLFDNGSTDRTSELIAESGLKFLAIGANRGIGHSYRIALDWALDRRFEFFGTMAGNGKMLASEVERLIHPLRNGSADYVTGSRFRKGGAYPNLPVFRRISIPIVSALASLSVGHRLTDATNGFRAFRLDLVRAAKFDLSDPSLDTYGFEYYFYAKALLDKRIRCIEVPTTMRYPPTGSYSKIRPGGDWIAMLRPWVAARFDPKGFGPLPRLERPET